jgi:ribosomal protein S18 acetylase RimI-like enzyme
MAMKLGIWRRQSSLKRCAPDKLSVSYERSVSPEAVQDICASVGWSKREPELIAQALENSVAVVSIWQADEDNSHLVAFARATGDRVFNATIWDVVVRPSHQRLGLGTMVMDELLKQLDAYEISLITLYTDPGTDSFYKRFGFVSDPSGVRGMFRERY